MPRTWTWMQVVLGWLPIGALFATLIITGHPGSSYKAAAIVATRMVFSAALLGIAVGRLAQRYPWPRKLTLRFLGIHVLGAAVFAHSWVLFNSLIVSMMEWQPVLAIGGGIGPFLILGVWVYTMIIGVLYAAQSTERAIRAEALATRAQLDALRAQLNPHFLFNALHTVVQLIPRDPARASSAAEQVAGLLRTAIEEDRDLVSLGDEWNFVERYLSVERLRFGDRLVIEVDLDPATLHHAVPSYALQTLVENAVRHGATPNVDATTIRVQSKRDGATLIIRVEDNGVGGQVGGASKDERAASTGLARLRERARALHGHEAKLVTSARQPRGYIAELQLPIVESDE